MTNTIYQMFERSCRTYGDKPLFERPGQAPISFAAALEQTRRLAAVLRELGVKPGDRVAAQVDKSPEAVLLYLACLQTGGVFLPLNTAYTGAEIDYFLGDAEPRLFVCRPETFVEHAARATAGMAVESLGTAGDGSLMARAEAAAPLTEAVARADDDLAAILYTSGTTGRSKGAMLTHRNLASNTEALVETWRFTEADRLIHALPIFHTHGLFVACNMALAAGATMIFLTRFDADEIITEMAEATVLMGVPTFYTRLLQSPRLDGLATAGMRLFVAGSAPLLAETHTEFTARTGHAILERYGMTETCMIASNPYDGERRPGAVGFALPGVEVRVADRETGAPLAQGEVGAIEVRGPNVFKGYWRMPEKTAAEFRPDGFFITGDLGLIDPDGYLRIVGRDKDLVISGGYNVYPKELEALIDELPEVLEFGRHRAAAPRSRRRRDRRGGAAPRYAARRRPGPAALSGKLARYKQPKRVIFVDELPRNVMGKVQKAELRSRYADLYRKKEPQAAS